MENYSLDRRLFGKICDIYRSTGSVTNVLLEYQVTIGAISYALQVYKVLEKLDKPEYDKHLEILLLHYQFMDNDEIADRLNLLTEEVNFIIKSYLHITFPHLARFYNIVHDLYKDNSVELIAMKLNYCEATIKRILLR